MNKKAGNYEIKGYPGSLELEDIYVFWDCLERDGLVSGVFYDGNVICGSDFVDFATGPGRIFYGVFIKSRPAALFWLDHIDESSARIHFSGLRWVFGPVMESIGHLVVQWLLNSSTRAGDYYFKVLVGVTPVSNPLAIKFIKRIGFKLSGFVPHALSLATGQCVDAVVSYITREQLNQSN